MAVARITSKGQVTIPKQVREQLGVDVGDELDFRMEGGRLEVRPIRRRRLSDFWGVFRVPKATDFSEERARAFRDQTRRLVEPEPADHE